MSFLYIIALLPLHPCGRTPAPPTHENPRGTRSELRSGAAWTLNLSNAMPANYRCNTNFHTSQIIPQSSMISKSQLTIHTRFERHFCDTEYQNSSQRNSQNAHAGLRAFLPLCCSAGTAVAQGSAARTFQTLRVHTLSLDVETANSIGINFTAKTMQKTATEIPNQQPINSKALRTPPAERPFECRSKQPHPARTACNPRTHVPAMRSHAKPATNSKAKDHGRGAKSTIQELPNTSRQLPNISRLWSDANTNIV